MMAGTKSESRRMRDEKKERKDFKLELMLNLSQRPHSQDDSPHAKLGLGFGLSFCRCVASLLSTLLHTVPVHYLYYLNITVDTEHQLLMVHDESQVHDAS
jgi:hypothetical protein